MKEDPKQRGQVPWHMWGASRTLTLPPTQAGALSTQLAKISYKRPDTWTFLLTAKLVSGNEVLVNDLTVVALIDLMIGVGRSRLQTNQNISVPAVARQAFARFQWLVPVGSVPGTLGNSNKYTTAVNTPPFDDNDANSFQVMREFPAQDIQVEATVAKIAAQPGQNVTVEVGAYFAPRTHFRPDWLRGPGEHFRFLGGEVGGT